MTDLPSLIERVSKATEADNELDVEVDVALFKPDSVYASVRPNNAGTKLVFTRVDGSRETCWSFDHTLDDETRKWAIALLRSLSAKEAGQ